MTTGRPQLSDVEIWQAVRIPIASAEVCKPSLENSSQPITHYEGKVQNLEKTHGQLSGFITYDSWSMLCSFSMEETCFGKKRIEEEEEEEE